MTPWRSRLDRADTHIAEVQAMVTNYFARSPFEFRREIEPHPLVPGWIQTAVCRGFVREEPPEQLAEALGDAVSSLKSALDRLVQALAKKGTATTDQLKRTEFPIFVADPSLSNSRQPFDKATNKQLAGVPDDALSFIEGIQPYRTNPMRAALEPLAMIHEIRRVDFHREAHITAAYGLVNGVHVHSTAGVAAAVSAPDAGTVEPFKTGEVLYKIRFQPQYQSDWRYDLEVETKSLLALLYGEDGAGHEVVGLLLHLRSYVDDQVLTPLEQYLG